MGESILGEYRTRRQLIADAEALREGLETEKAISEGFADDREALRKALRGARDAVEEGDTMNALILLDAALTASEGQEK